MTALLELTELHTYYGHIHALKGIDVRVDEGEIVTLVGSNGAGKSTTLRTISGIAKARFGKVTLNGRDITGLKPHEIAGLGIGHVPEGRRIFPLLTVRENLEIGAWNVRDRNLIATRMEEMYVLFPRLKERLFQKGGTLSGGEQQMLAMARALMARPRLLLLDEPSLGLAPQVVTTIFQIIREINATGTTILLVEQNAHMALKVAHRAYVLETGEIAMEGPAQQLAESDEVRKAYLGIG